MSIISFVPVLDLSQDISTWKDVYLKTEDLKENWQKGKFHVKEFCGHTGR